MGTQLAYSGTRATSKSHGSGHCNAIGELDSDEKCSLLPGDDIYKRVTAKDDANVYGASQIWSRPLDSHTGCKESGETNNAVLMDETFKHSVTQMSVPSCMCAIKQDQSGTIVVEELECFVHNESHCSAGGGINSSTPWTSGKYLH